MTSSQDVFVLTEQVVFNEMSGCVCGTETKKLYRNTRTFSAMFLETNLVILTSSQDVFVLTISESFWEDILTFSSYLTKQNQVF